MEDDSQLLRPRPERPGTRTPNSPSESSTPSTPVDPSGDNFMSRTRSVLNLTSSTLFGIYAPTETDGLRTEPSTPWGTGSQTPNPRPSIDEDRRPPVIGAFEQPELRRHATARQQGVVASTFLIAIRTLLLFGFGVAYGVVISHLHDTEKVAPVQVQGIQRWSWGYLTGWGLVGIALGGLLPWVDVLWEDVLGIDKDIFRSNSQEQSQDAQAKENPSDDHSPRSPLADWNPVVRSIGAFIGIAFAIRRLPWQSTSQVSLTLALVNPVLWYLIDRSKPGFLLSTVVGLAGTAIVVGLNPDIVPSPAVPSRSSRAMAKNASIPLYDAASGIADVPLTNENIGVGVWIASVLFCSSVCFGNIGRRLSLGPAPSRRSSTT